MIKKSLSLFLCIIMIFSCFGVVAPEVYAAERATGLFSVKSEPVADGKLVYTISLANAQKDIAGFIVNVKFDSNVLKPTNNCGTVKKSGQDGAVDNLEGTYVYAVNESNPDMYSIAYMNTIAVTTTQSTAFFKLEFEVLDPTRPATDVLFYCKEYFSTSETDKNISATQEPVIIAEYGDVSTLEIPELVGVEPYSDGLVFSWNSVEGASGYTIRRMAEGGTWQVVCTVDGSQTAFYDAKLTSGVVYKYTVNAVNDSGVSLYNPNGVSCKYIDKPAIVSLKNVVGGVELTWGITDGADCYYVYRRVAGENEWEYIGKKSSGLSTSYKDATVVDGVTYEYDVNSGSGEFESHFSSLGEAITYVSTPDIKKISNAFDGIEVSWEAHPQATHYEIYRKVGGVDADFVKYTEVTSTSFVDEDVETFKSYSYAVKACTANGESAYSTSGYTITYIAPTGITSLMPEKNGISLSWNSVDNVDGYSIYRKQTNSSDWIKIGSTDKDTLSYYDTTVTSGCEYVYSVCPYISTSESIKLSSDPIYFIKAPAGVVAENLVEGIKVTWEASQGAYKYEVLRVEENGTYTKVAEVNDGGKLEFLATDTEWAKKYTYAVKAISLKGESLISEHTVSTMRLGAMKVSSLEIADGGIKVSWDAIDYATGYAVYKSFDGKWLQIATVEDVYFIDSNVESAKTYSYAVAVIMDTSRGILDTENPLSIKYIAPPKITSASNGSNYSKITWSAVEGAASYDLYRAENGDELNYEMIATVDSKQLSYVDYNVEAGKTYVYTVKSNDGEKESAFSNEFKNTFLEIPQIHSIANAYGGITFSWKPVEGAQKYHVYRKIYGAKYYTYITTVDANVLSFTDDGATNGKIMCYTVKAVGAHGTSAYLAKCMTYVEAPEVAFSNSASGVFLKWDKNDSAVGYWVYRKAGNAKTWTRIAVVTTPYYTDTKVTSGTKYTYTVKSYTGKILSACNMSGWTIKHLSVPTLVSATNGYGSVTVSWQKVPGAAAYYVYRKDNGAGNWTCIGKTTAVSYKDANVKHRSTYEYTVRAYYGSDISYYKTKGVTTKYIEAPQLTVANRTGNVQLSWNSVSGATSYYIYRKAGRATSWTQIATVTTTSYTDKNVVNGTTYRYTIKAYCQKTLSGHNSTGWATVYLATPKLVSAVSGTAGITVKWQSVKWSTGYMIFRKTGNGSWVHIGTVNGTNALTYVDKTAVKGTTYTYTVRAYYGNYRSWFQSGLKCTDKY